MKQIDENVKKININNKKINSSRNNSMTMSVSDNEINKLKLRLITQQKTILNTKSNIEKMNTSLNKVNELIKSTNFKKTEFDPNKITNALAECKTVVQNMSKGLNNEVNKTKININLSKNRNTKNINELLKQSIQKENLVNVKNLKDKNLPKQIFKQYFINLSKFSKTIIDYGLNDNDTNDDKNL